MDGQFMYVGSSYNAVAFYQHNQSDNLIDRPTYSHLGKKVKFNSLDESLKKLVISDYKEIWNIKE